METIVKLHPLEISTNEDDDSAIKLKNDTDDNENEHLPVMSKQLIQSSAVKAQENISRWSKEILSPALEDVEN